MHGVRVYLTRIDRRDILATDLNLEKETVVKQGSLNATCPFGHRSTNYFSREGRAPDLNEANQANRAINAVLKQFVEHLQTSSASWAPVQSDVYDAWGEKSVLVSENVPRYLSKVIPIRPARCSEVILAEIEGFNSPAMNIVIQLHDMAFADKGSHMQAARKVMGHLKENYLGIFRNGLHVKSTVLDPVADGLPISDEMKQVLIAYQDLQERCDTVDEVRRMNALIRVRQDLVRGILGIQVELCREILAFLSKNPELQDSTLAFSEIALWNEATGEMTPSTRLLKLILHNWGKYFLEKPRAPLNELLRNAAKKALDEGIYNQSIFVFRTHEEEVRLYGVAPKVCPARLAVGEMVLHYLPE